jgi:hypothetical protein
MGIRQGGMQVSLSFLSVCARVDESSVHKNKYLDTHDPKFILTPYTNRNDGDEPDYMAVNPTDWLSSTMEACCKKFFGGYRYDACMGRYPPDSDDCNVMLFYPDWEGGNQGCTDDGK